MTELANPGWGALAALLVPIWRMDRMTNAIERLDASVARIAQDVSDVVERIRGNVGIDSAAVLADCDRLDTLSEALEGVGGETHEEPRRRCRRTRPPRRTSRRAEPEPAGRPGDVCRLYRAWRRDRALRQRHALTGGICPLAFRIVGGSPCLNRSGYALNA